MLNLYRALTRLRRSEPALNIGDYTAVETGADDIFAYLRTAPDAARFLIVLNFGRGLHTLNLSHVARQATISVVTDMVRSGSVDLSSLACGSNEGLVLRID